MTQIASGQFKGVSLIVPPKVRATEAKVRQAIFNILQGAIPGARVLDGFAGSGSLGLEALSHGADFVAFIESDTEAVMAIRDNLARLGPDLSRDNWRVVHAEVERGLRLLAECEAPFDVVLFDPPYDSPDARKALISLGQYAMLTPAAIVGVEHEQRTVLPLTIGPLTQWKRHRYGDTVLSLYKAPA